MTEERQTVDVGDVAGRLAHLFSGVEWLALAAVEYPHSDGAQGIASILEAVAEHGKRITAELVAPAAVS